MADDDRRDRQVGGRQVNLSLAVRRREKALGEPIEQVPSPAARAASIRFCAASAQSIVAHGPSVLLAMTIRTGAS